MLEPGSVLVVWKLDRLCASRSFWLPSKQT